MMAASMPRTYSRSCTFSNGPRVTIGSTRMLVAVVDHAGEFGREAQRRPFELAGGQPDGGGVELVEHFDFVGAALVSCCLFSLLRGLLAVGAQR